MLFFFFGIFSASPNVSPSSRTYLPESMIYVLLTSSLVFFLLNERPIPVLQQVLTLFFAAENNIRQGLETTFVHQV